MLFGLFQERAEAQFPVHLKKIEIPSTLDQTLQPSMFWAPHVDTPRPILVFLHSWSGDYRQDNIRWLKEAVERKWIFLHPNFRGRNNHPEACGSELARQDILDAIDWVMKNVPVDRERVYLAGSSGGGHMAMLMAGHAPDRFSAVSAWVGISDLRRWYEFHTRTGAPDNYGKMILNSLSGSPGESPEIDLQYQDRSPICHLHQVGNLPLDLCAGLHDGHTGSVPIDHSLLAFNVIASANHFPLI
ncbi:MAG: prolyl oligopeptidase family serine peptidase, partial [Planctomycetaceae bacterium]|nr:prolyl oligopeptidase family serine peptidase [Planctomycetaceae bacterium]